MHPPTPSHTHTYHYRTALPCRVDVRRPRGALRPPDTRRLLRAPATLCEALAGRVGRRPSSMDPSAPEWALLPPRFAAISRFDRARDGETLRIGDVAPSLPSSRSRRLRWMRTGDHSCGGGSRSVSVRTRSACASARCCATATSAAPRLASRAVWAHVAQSARRIRSVSVTIAYPDDSRFRAKCGLDMCQHFWRGCSAAATLRISTCVYMMSGRTASIAWPTARSVDVLPHPRSRTIEAPLSP